MTEPEKDDENVHRFEGALVRAGHRIGLRSKGGHILFLDEVFPAIFEGRQFVLTVKVLPP